MPLSVKSACLFRRGVGAADISKGRWQIFSTHTRIKCDETKKKKKKEMGLWDFPTFTFFARFAL